MFLEFHAKHGRYAIRPFLGGVNAISGETLVPDMRTVMRRLNNIECKQDYVVTQSSGETQKWLDGAVNGRGVVRQFVALPLDSNESVEHQATGTNNVGGLQLEIIPQFEYLDSFHISLSDSGSETRHGKHSKNPEDLLPATSYPFTTPRELGIKPGQPIYARWQKPRYFPSSQEERRFEEIESEISLRDRTLLDEWIALGRRKGAYLGQSSWKERKLIFSPFLPIKNRLRILFQYHGMETIVTLDQSWTVHTFGHRACEHMNLERSLDRYRFLDKYDRRVELTISHLEDLDLLQTIEEQIGGGGPGNYTELVVGAGAKIRQNIITDTVDPWRWDTRRAKLLNIQIVNSQQFRTLAGGLPPPPSPISYQTYLQLGIPFWHTKDENDVTFNGGLDMIKPVSRPAELTESTGTAKISKIKEKKSRRRSGRGRDDAGPKYPEFCQLCKKAFFTVYR